MLRRVILAGLSTCLFALTFGFSPTALAAEPTCRTPQVEARINDLTSRIRRYERRWDRLESEKPVNEGAIKTIRDRLKDLYAERSKLENLPPCTQQNTGASPRGSLGGGTYAVGGWSYGSSGALTYPHTNFIDRGSASGSAGALCADVSKDLWGSGLRYAGEFSGFRIAATASACQGFGTASQFVPLGGFDGKTSFSTFFTAGGRVELPLNLGGLHIVPFAGAGGAYAHVKVQAFPFESNSSWRTGAYWEVGGAVPVPRMFSGWVRRKGSMRCPWSYGRASSGSMLAIKRLMAELPPKQTWI